MNFYERARTATHIHSHECVGMSMYLSGVVY